jgi:membrane protease YdiL (CAAX protease family)
MFIEQAYKGNNDWWRVIITTFVSTIIFVLNFIVFLVFPQEDIDKSYELMNSMPKIISLIFNLAPFAILLGMLFLLVFFLHQRSILSLTTSRVKVDFKRIAFSFGLIVFFSILTFGVSYYNDHSNIVWNFHPYKFLLLFVVSCILFPFQIGFEEYLFRGYLMQQIGIIAKNRWFPFVITSVFFGLFHSANPEVSEMGYGVMFFYIGTGFLLGLMTLMDEGLELSLGFHLGNNMIAALLITSDYSALQTDAVFKLSAKEPSSDTLNEMIITMLIVYPILIFILAKKYKWTNWKEKLTGKVTENINFNTLES